MTENSKSNDDNGAGQIALTDDLFGWPGDGVHWTWQRCGRYEYRKVLMHSTNPDHLVPSAARVSGGFLRVADRYAAGAQAWLSWYLVRLRELAAELGFWPATTDEADIERHPQHNKNAGYCLARRHRFDHLRREHERQT